MFRQYPVLVFLCLFNPLNAQQGIALTNSFSESPDYKIISGQQKRYMDSLYVRRVNISDELINGREYVPYYFKSKVKPLLSEEKKRSGSLVFNGRRYDNLFLEYDTYRDQLIYSDSTKLMNDKVFKIALNKDPVDEFSLIFSDDSMIFRYFTPIKERTFNLPAGFYEVVYDGKAKCIIKHQSFLVEKDGLYEYRYSPVEYVRVESSFSRVKSGKGFIKLFGNESDEVRKFMRTNKVHFHRAGKEEIATVMRYYDTLISNK
jgi:hypothetical protein